IRQLAGEIAALRKAGTAVTLVSSGAIAAGRSRIPTPARPTIPERQAAAAVGQIHLMVAYETAFARHDIPVAQILLDAEDLTDRHRFLNATHAIEMLHRHDILPIVNENDTVSVDELKFGDNDHLSAMVASLVAAEVLVILSDVDGVYSAPPDTNPDASRIPVIRRVDARLLARTRSGSSRFGTGGMESKLLAARKAANAGIPTIIADGRAKGALSRALDPTQDEGTLVLATAGRRAPKRPRQP
ncbi:MAG: glutamate 5-kinase, partial [bacterium]